MLTLILLITVVVIGLLSRSRDSIAGTAVATVIFLQPYTTRILGVYLKGPIYIYHYRVKLYI